MTFPAHPPTLCPCGRHKDRCRCAGRREAWQAVLDLMAKSEDGDWDFLAFQLRALANGAP
jgi:hypothetical protein